MDLLDKEPVRMDDIYTYHIEVRGRVDKHDLRTMCPIEITEVREETAATLFAIRGDQSGLIGLIRYLHGRGFILLSVTSDR
jgi:hypothetical protein